MDKRKLKWNHAYRSSSYHFLPSYIKREIKTHTEAPPTADIPLLLHCCVTRLIAGGNPKILGLNKLRTVCFSRLELPPLHPAHSVTVSFALPSDPVIREASSFPNQLMSCSNTDRHNDHTTRIRPDLGSKLCVEAQMESVEGLQGAILVRWITAIHKVFIFKWNYPNPPVIWF